MGTLIKFVHILNIKQNSSFLDTNDTWKIQMYLKLMVVFSKAAGEKRDM